MHKHTRARTHTHTHTHDTHTSEPTRTCLASVRVAAAAAASPACLDPVSSMGCPCSLRPSSSASANASSSHKTKIEPADQRSNEACLGQKSLMGACVQQQCTCKPESSNTSRIVSMSIGKKAFQPQGLVPSTSSLLFCCSAACIGAVSKPSSKCLRALFETPCLVLCVGQYQTPLELVAGLHMQHPTPIAKLHLTHPAVRPELYQTHTTSIAGLGQTHPAVTPELYQTHNTSIAGLGQTHPILSLPGPQAFMQCSLCTITLTTAEATKM
eukprot:1113508-Pelagomonas_calceolata.AAC.1